jgi:hypothetical protein
MLAFEVKEIGIPIHLSGERNTMKIGTKAQGQSAFAKRCVSRHGGGSKRSMNACEKATETKVRQAGKKACREVS